jgi:hypothetical protein
MPATEILTRWIAVARTRNNTILVLALWHARDIADGIAFQCYDPFELDTVVDEIRGEFDRMDQKNAELVAVREELGI